MTSKRLLLYFFDIEDFFIDCVDTIGLSEDRIGSMTSIEEGIEGLKRVSEDRIGLIAPIGTSRVL